MSYILGVDTSTKAASVAIIKDGKLLGEVFTNHKLKHSDKLIPLIKNLLTDLKIDISDIDFFACGTGPGSFTGLRVSGAAIKAFAHRQNKKIIGISSLEITSYPLVDYYDNVCIIFDAQKKDIYYNIYNKGKALGEDEIIDIDSLIEKIKTLKGSTIISGDGVYKYMDYIKEALGESIAFAKDYNTLPKASSLCYLARKYILKSENIYTYDNFLPNYIRNSSAEDKKNG